MVAFKTMWEDVCSILSNDEIKDIDIVEKFSTGFVVKENDNTEFITRDDFVDFWCKLLCMNEISREEIIRDEKPKLKFVYDVVKRLPYIKDNGDMIKLTV